MLLIVFFHAIFSFMTIEQTMQIPNDHRLAIDLPREIPAGTTVWVELKVFPFVKKEEKPVVAGSQADTLPKLRLTKKELHEMLDKSPITRELTGILSNLGNITIEQIRDERLAKYSV
jgi:hypothetical protein